MVSPVPSIPMVFSVPWFLHFLGFPRFLQFLGWFSPFPWVLNVPLDSSIGSSGSFGFNSFSNLLDSNGFTSSLRVSLVPWNPRNLMNHSYGQQNHGKVATQEPEEPWQLKKLVKLLELHPVCWVQVPMFVPVL